MTVTATDSFGPDGVDEPRGMDQDDFLDEVQSFSFWFGAVEGYLADRPYGYDPDTVDGRWGRAWRQERHHAVQLLRGRAAALEASSGMVRLAPNHNARIFMATQIVDEARHLEVFLNRLAEARRC